MNTLTDEQAIQFLNQIIVQNGYTDFSDLLSYQKNRLDAYNLRNNEPLSNTLGLDFKLKKQPYIRLFVRLNFSEQSVDIMNYKLFENHCVITNSKMKSLERVEKIKKLLID